MLAYLSGIFYRFSSHQIKPNVAKIHPLGFSTKLLHSCFLSHYGLHCLLPVNHLGFNFDLAFSLNLAISLLHNFHKTSPFLPICTAKILPRSPYFMSYILQHHSYSFRMLLQRSFPTYYFDHVPLSLQPSTGFPFFIKSKISYSSFRTLVCSKECCLSYMKMAVNLTTN